MASKDSVRVEDATYRCDARADATAGLMRVIVITQLARFNNDLVRTRRDYHVRTAVR